MFSVRFLGARTYSLLTKSFSTDRGAWISVLDDPKIRSPFDNPRKTLASPRPLESIPVSAIKSETASSFVDSHAFLNGSENLKIESSSVQLNQAASINSSENSGSNSSSGATNGSDDGGLPRKQVDGFITRLTKKYGLFIDKSLPEQEQKTLRTTRATKVGCFVVFGGLFVTFVWFCVKNGRAKRDETGSVVVDEHTGSWFASFYRIGDAMYFWKRYITEPIRENLLPDPLKPPYYQPKYTVVIEMKHVLVHPEWTYKTGYRFKKRPAVEYFLEASSFPQFELVLYTSESSMTAPAIVENLDPNHKIFFRLYRECNKFINGHYVKDLSRLNRDLSKVIYIDFDPKSFQLNPENVLRVKKWEGDMSDTSLVDLAELLKTIFLSDTDDVRPILQYYSQFDDPAAEFRRRATMIMEQEKQAEEEQKQAPNQLKRLTARKFFGFQRHQYV